MKRGAGGFAVVVAAVLAAAAFAGPGPTRLSASIAARPGVSGVFLATLKGQALSWQLMVRGLGTTALRVRLGRSGPVAATLCASCARSERGTSSVTPAAARALARGTAYLDLKPAKSTSPRVQVQIVQGVPTLEITSLHDGDRITLPAEVGYHISNFAVGPAPLGHIELLSPGVAAVELAVSGADGTLTIPDVKSQFLVGHRDLTFALVTADGTPLPNAEARVTIRGVTIQGRR